MTGQVLTGLDRIARGEAEILKQLRGRRVGLLAHSASVDAKLRHISDVFAEQGIKLSALFAPEHGFSARLQDMEHVAEESWRGIPLFSLYGKRFEDLSPRKEWLSQIDVLVIDMQDVGSRYYTFIWTAALALKAAAAQKISCVVLDRPNPLGGVAIEGAPQQNKYNSFVGLYPIAVRHGMTMAEVLRWVARSEKLPDDSLQVVPMQGWQRAMLWNDTGLPWVQPSPNMPTFETALVYPGGCLIEGTRLSEGRGTTKPFEIWGAPGLNIEILKNIPLAGAALRSLQFTPMFHKHARQICAGIQVHITDPRSFQPRAAYAKILSALLRQLPSDQRWRSEEYEFVSDRLAIDLLWGSPAFRDCVDNKGEVDEVLRIEEPALRDFSEKRREFLLYE